MKDVQKLIEVQSIRSSSQYKRVYDLEQREYFTDGTILTSTHAATSLGDIYERADGKLYLLLTQPCDLALRSNGTRTGRVRDGVLVQLTAPDKTDTDDKLVPQYQARLPPIDTEGNRVRVDFRIAHRVHLDVLDVTVMSIDGSATIALDDPEPSPLLYTLVGRRSSLHRVWRRDLDKVTSITPHLKLISADLRDETQLRLVEWSAHCAPFKPKLELESKKLRFNFKRVRRLREDLAAILLVRYHDYCAREAREHPLSRGISPLEASASENEGGSS